MKLAFDGITAFSYKPLIFSAYIGVISLFIGIILFIGVSIRDLIKHISLLNISFILSINLIMCGFILISMGILGQYIGRIMDETKDRPLYIVDNIINYKNTQGRQEIKYIK
jgi:dolichol-phosphate mannosyltransferase